MGYMRYVGWDVHAETVVVAEAQSDRDLAHDLDSCSTQSNQCLAG